MAIWSRPSLVYHVFNPDLFLNSSQRREIYLKSIIAPGFQSTENVYNHHVSQRIYEGLAYGCVVISEHPDANKMTNGIVEYVANKEEFHSKVKYFLARPDECEKKRIAGYEWIKKNGTNRSVAMNFIEKIKELWSVDLLDNSPIYDAIFEKTFYINLDRRVDKNEHMLTLQKEFGFKAERYPAIDGKNITADMKTKLINDNIVSPSWDETNGVLGCLLSHYNIYKKIATWPNETFNKWKWFLIVEDDVNFHPVLRERPEILTMYFNNLPIDAEYVKLTTSVIGAMPELKHTNKFVAKAPGAKCFCSTIAYAIKQSFANKLLYSFPTKYPIDLFLLHNFNDKAYYFKPIDDFFWKTTTPEKFFVETRPIRECHN